MKPKITKESFHVVSQSEIGTCIKLAFPKGTIIPVEKYSQLLDAKEASRFWQTLYPNETEVFPDDWVSVYVLID